jgi:ATP-dependent RNA helicase DeaD
LPTNVDTLKHRSGRTGRAGRKGVSAIIVPMPARRRTERLLQNAGIQAEWANPPSAESILKRDDERLLADPLLTIDVAEDEADIVTAMIAAHGAEKIAAAFVRQFRSTRFAPEDIQDVPMQQVKSKDGKPRQEFDAGPARPREDFEGSVWFSLSVGRKQNAEPRWLIPMLCKAGKISKREIGAIKMQQTETFVEILESAADGFVSALGSKMMIEDSLRVTKLAGAPDLSSSRGGWKDNAKSERPEGARPRPASFAAKTDGDGAKKDWKKKPFNKDGGKPPFKKSEGKPYFAKGKPGTEGGKPDWKKKKG